MERGLILLLATLMVSLAPGVRGTSHLSFSNNTECNITRAGCGKTKLCLEYPDDCDPTTNKMCQFTSLKISRPANQSGVYLLVQLQGYSSGYIALGLAANTSEGISMVFVCARNSTDGSFFFRTMRTNGTNFELIPTERRVKEIRGLVNGSVIKCEFTVPNLNASMTRNTEDTTFNVSLGNGSVTNNVLGPFNAIVNGGRLNIANPAANIATTTAATTTTTTTTATTAATVATTGSSGALQPPAVLALLSVFICTVMLRT